MRGSIVVRLGDGELMFLMHRLSILKYDLGEWEATSASKEHMDIHRIRPRNGDVVHVGASRSEPPVTSSGPL